MSAGFRISSLCGVCIVGFSGLLLQPVQSCPKTFPVLPVLRGESAKDVLGTRRNLQGGDGPLVCAEWCAQTGPHQTQAPESLHCGFRQHGAKALEVNRRAAAPVLKGLEAESPSAAAVLRYFQASAVCCVGLLWIPNRNVISGNPNLPPAAKAYAAE